MDRRKFLKQAGKAVGVAALTAGGGVLLARKGRRASPSVGSGIPEFTVPSQPGTPVVTEAALKDPATSLRAALEAIGGIGRFVRPGERVVLKPNSAWDRTPEQAANTHPALVGEMARLCLEAGARQVVVTDVTCNDARQSFTRSGILAAAEQAGATVILPSDNDYVEMALQGTVLKTWPVLRSILEADRMINMPIAKHHGLSRCTVGMKNLYGVIGGRRRVLHQEIDKSIVELTLRFNPTLTVVDATRILVRSGPQGGSLDDVESPGIVLCGTDPVAVDARACEILGASFHEVPYLALAEASGLGLVDYRKAGYRKVQA